MTRSTGGSDPQITLEQVDDGTYVATSSALPGYVARGESEGAVLRKIRRALKLSFKSHERDFVRSTYPLGRRRRREEAFRWSRWRAPLYLRPPLSRNVKITLAAFGAGVAFGIGALAVRRVRR